MFNNELFSHIPAEYAELFKGDEFPHQSLGKVKAFIQSQYGDDVVIIGEGTTIGENVVIEPPVIIGAHCTIMPHSLIRPYSIICDNVTIGHAAEVKHSFIMPNAKVQSFTFTGDSIIGKSARVGSGTILANRGFNQENIHIKTAGGDIDSGTDFLGCVIGDYARLGANSTTQPGTIIGQYSWVFPATNIWGIIPNGKRVRNEKSLIISDNERCQLKD